MASIVTYDVPSRHVDLKKTLFAKGYQDYIIHIDSNGNKRTIHLPNTTVYHPSKNAEQARNDVQDSSAGLNIELERCVATQWGPDWAVIFGKPFGS